MLRFAGALEKNQNESLKIISLTMLLDNLNQKTVHKEKRRCKKISVQKTAITASFKSPFSLPFRESNADMKPWYMHLDK